MGSLLGKDILVVLTKKRTAICGPFFLSSINQGQANGLLTWIVWSRRGPTEISTAGHPANSSSLVR